MEQISLPLDIRTRLRPIQVGVKETNQFIMCSPWAPLFRQAANGGDPAARYAQGHYATHSAASQGQMPMTPQSAALGPAVQATVPSTPQSASFANAFNGNVFERADALMAMGGLSFSRTGTMNNSISSTASHSMTPSHDERHGPPNMFSPNGNTGHIPFRLNGGVKPF